VVGNLKVESGARKLAEKIQLTAWFLIATRSRIAQMKPTLTTPESGLRGSEPQVVSEWFTQFPAQGAFRRDFNPAGGKDNMVQSRQCMNGQEDSSRNQTRLQIRVLRRLADVEALRSTWSGMQSHPNADIDFFSLIVRTRPEIVRPHVIVVFEEGRPITIVAGRLEENQLEIKIGYKTIWRPKVRQLTIVYGGCMGETSHDVDDLIVRQLFQFLREEQADLLSWSGLPWSSRLKELVRSVPGILCRDYLARPSEHWTMTLPASLEEFLEQKMNKKHRYWAKRAMRMLEKDFPGAVRYACLTRPDEVDKLFEDTVRVARKTYQWGLGVGFQDNLENRQRLQLAAEKGWLAGYVLYLKDEPIAFWLCTVYGDTVHLNFTGYVPDFRKYEIGTALFLRMVGEMSVRKVKRLDFGLGSAFYKERFGDGKFTETTMFAFAPTGRGILLNALRLLTQAPAELARKVLLRLKLEQKIKKLWRTQVTPNQEKKLEGATNS